MSIPSNSTIKNSGIQPMHSLSDHTFVRPIATNVALLKDSFCTKLSDSSPLLDIVKRVAIVALSIITLPIFGLLSISGLIHHALEKKPANPAQLVSSNDYQKMNETPEPIVSSEEAKSINPLDESQSPLSERLQNKRIVVMTRGLGGMGDYMCARKICLYLHENLGLKLENIALGTRCDESLKKTLSAEGINVIDDKYESRQKWGADIQIFAPVADQWYVSDKLALGDVPSLAIAEYGFNKPDFIEKDYKNAHAYALGLNDTSMGILLHDELLSWSSKPKQVMERLQKLEAVPEKLQKAILSQDYSEKAIKTFAENSKLYFSYAHHESQILSFTQAVANMNHALKDKSNLCFYFMGNDLNKPEYWRNKDEICEYLKGQGIGSIEYVSIDYPKTNETITLGAGKTLKIVVGDLPPNHVKDMHMASEYETLATGDQSFSESISAGKLPAYETYTHKKELRDQFYEALPPIIKSSMEFYSDTRVYSFEDSKLELKLSANKLAQFYINRRTDKRIERAAQEAIESIKTNYNFGKRFENALTKLLDSTKGVKKIQSIKISLPEESRITGDEIPFDKLYLLEGKDICKMKIRFNGVSELACFSDSLFSTKCVSTIPSYYVITRNKNKVLDKVA